MILKLKTRDEFMAVWEALNQYIDAAENGGQRRLRALPSVKADASLFEKVTVEG